MAEPSPEIRAKLLQLRAEAKMRAERDAQSQKAVRNAEAISGKPVALPTDKKAKGGAIKPLSESQFHRHYSQHVDVRHRQSQKGEETKQSILGQGFSPNFGINTLPPYRGGLPSDVTAKMYAPRKGDYVYLVPPHGIEKTKNGMKVKQGWKPESHEIIRVDSDYPNMYQEYLKHFPTQKAKGGSIPSLEEFRKMVSQGRMRMARSKEQELNDLLAGKAKFAERRMNLNDPEDDDLAENLQSKGFKLTQHPVHRDVYLIHKTPEDIEPILKAKNPVEYGRAYGYSEPDIAAFYHARRQAHAHPDLEKHAYKEYLADLNKKADGGSIPSLDVMRLAIGGAPDQSPFYSAADQAAQQLQRAKGTGAEFLTELTKAKGVKPAEVEHRRLGEIGKLPKMTKDQFMAEMSKRPMVEVKQIIKTLDDEAYDKALEEAIVYQAEAYASSVSGDPQEQKQIMKERIEEIKNNPEYLDSIKDDLFPWGNEMAPQFDRSDLKLPGGKKYREILFQLPFKPDAQGNLNTDFQSSHWDEPNIVAHARIQDRDTPTGKAMHIEEIQSDWHQRGRKEGYQSTKKIPYLTGLTPNMEVVPDKFATHPLQHKFYVRDKETGLHSGSSGMTEEEAIQNWLARTNRGIDYKNEPNPNLVPDAPFKKNWHEMVLNALLHRAAEEGHDHILITPGAEQNDRYDLSKHVDRIDYFKNADGTYNFVAYSKSNAPILHKQDIDADEMSNYIGKDVSQKIVDASGQPKPEKLAISKIGRNWEIIDQWGEPVSKHKTKMEAEGEVQRMQSGAGTLSNVDLKIGGEGMKGFYDKMIPDYLNKVGKKHGVKVEMHAHPIEAVTEWDMIPSPTPKTVHAHRFQITPEMRQEILQNKFPMYERGGVVHKASGGGVPSQAAMRLAIGGQGPRNWLKGSVEKTLIPLLSKKPTAEDDELLQQQNEGYRNLVLAARLPATHIDAINNWVKSNLANYIRKQMGSPKDPVRDLAEQGILHFDPDTVPIIGAHADRHEHAEIRRQMLGGQQMAKGPLAQAWEDAVDSRFEPHSIKDMMSIPEMYRGQIEPWMSKADPKTDVYEPYAFDELGFGHIVDILKQDLREGRIRPEQLNRVSMADAVKRTHQYDQERKKAMAETALKATEGMPVHKDYGNGFKWIELTKPKLTGLPEGHTLVQSPNTNTWAVKDSDGKLVNFEEDGASYGPWYDTKEEAIEDAKAARSNNLLKDALKYEGDTMGHCVGGYCPDVAAGQTRIFSLRDAKNEPHVTIEVKPSTGIALSPEEFYQHKDAPQSLLQKINEAEAAGHLNDIGSLEVFVKSTPEYNQYLKSLPPAIKQIKGKGNAKPHKDYIPYVQDFVRSGNWSDIGDFKNTDLVKHEGKLLTKDEHADWLLSQLKPDQKADGGNVDAETVFMASGGYVSPESCFFPNTKE